MERIDLQHAMDWGRRPLQCVIGGGGGAALEKEATRKEKKCGQQQWMRRAAEMCPCTCTGLGQVNPNVVLWWAGCQHGPNSIIGQPIASSISLILFSFCLFNL